MSLRVTHRSLFASNLENLQQNLRRISRTQEELSSGKALRRPSDNPSDTGAALLHRAEIDRSDQLLRNADDALGWLSTADSTLNGANNVMARVRELLVSANNTVSGPDARDAIADEVETLREQMLALSNSKYLGRPIFGGTTANPEAYDDTGAYVGDTSTVERSVRPGVTVQVNVTGPDVFETGGNDIFTFLDDVVNHLRTDPSQLSADLAETDDFLSQIKDAWSTVGARYGEVESMRSRTDEDLLVSKQKLSNAEDIDLPATIVELQLQETAYQAALSATARSVQPSLLDFLR